MTVNTATLRSSNRQRGLQLIYYYDCARTCVYGVLHHLTQVRDDPIVHGNKFKLADSSTWGEPTDTLELEDSKWVTVQIQHWSGLHFRLAAIHPLQVLRITVVGKHVSKRSPKPMWLGWLGESMPVLEQTWRCYLRRFAVDHWNRFAKQRLHWTLPNFSTTELAERWSELMPLLSWQLWLAREIVQDNPLPWQKSQTELTLLSCGSGISSYFSGDSHTGE